MAMVVDGKTVVVTGVGPGLGGEVARVVLRDGGNAVLAARTEAKLEQIAAELDPSGERVAFRATDINSADDCRALMDLAKQRFGGVDGIVQVAAYDTAMGGLDETTDDTWRDVLATNVTGTMHVVSAAAQAMEGRGGSVVLIGSQSSVLPAVMFQLAYASSKGALTAAMFHLAKELGPKKIRVNQVVPTWMWGPPVQGYVQYASQSRDISEEEVIAEITERMPLGEIPADDDVAEAAVWLCSDRARMITGQTLYVNAGEFMT
jgi:NAD(P)-dependent dehydrogenase (short-subunit alcohol dehydrogenase family)